MKSLQVVVISAMALASCATVGSAVMLVHKTGSSFAERELAFDQCKIASLREIPQAMATQMIGGYSNPGSLQCNTIGTATYCNTVGAFSIPAQSVSYDANRDIRARYIARCLASKGYSLIPTRVCSSPEERARADVAWVNQPPAAQIACVSTPTLDDGMLY